MSEYLGIDTSNYTTSVAVYNSDTKKVIQEKKLLPVKEGSLGLRQSDAVFHHTKQLPEIIKKLYSENISGKPCCITASARPRELEGSYMPCFLCGAGFAESYAVINKIPCYLSSHQMGHILASVYSADCFDILDKKFIAFHVSGGTTDCLLCESDSENILKIKQVSSSLDLKAGQAVDRIGLMMGLKFPCGKELEKLAFKSDISNRKMKFRIKPVLKNADCCLSGLENRCRKMLDDGITKEDTARYCLEYIAVTVTEMTEKAFEEYGKMPVIYAGGVMSDKIIKDIILDRFDAYFAEPEFSCDNAVGMAIYGFLKNNMGDKNER